VADDGTLPMIVQVEPAKMHSIGVGVAYSSGEEGASAQTFWENRNVFGRAERLRIGGRVSQIGETAGLTFKRPDFFATDQDLVFETAYEIENTEAYNAKIYSALLALERPLFGLWRGSAGVAFKVGPVDESHKESSTSTRTDSSRDVLLVGLPLTLRRDSSNSILDPTEGTKLDIGVTPYSKELGSDASFVVSQLSDTAYLPLRRDRRVVAAGRLALGSISGAGTFVVPADERLYSGGGGSVRGFGYQMAGPLDADDDPTGGRSLFEVSAEVRWRITESIGLVPFIDGGGVFTDAYPSFDRELFWGAGLGFRYFSPVGPVRIDIATPLNPRSGVDDPVQFYISLGQAY
jgi:translocation and assembly module TamA